MHVRIKKVGHHVEWDGCRSDDGDFFFFGRFEILDLDDWPYSRVFVVTKEVNHLLMGGDVNVDGLEDVVGQCSYFGRSWMSDGWDGT